nr:unnamed protein product [Digitaria exilis]
MLLFSNRSGLNSSPLSQYLGSLQIAHALMSTDPEGFPDHQLEVAEPRDVVLGDGAFPLEGLTDLGLRFGH